MLFGEGTGNLPRAEPRFVNSLAGDLRLQAGSPAVGVADPAYTPPMDNAGKPHNAAPLSWVHSS